LKRGWGTAEGYRHNHNFSKEVGDTAEGYRHNHNFSKEVGDTAEGYHHNHNFSKEVGDTTEGYRHNHNFSKEVGDTTEGITSFRFLLKRWGRIFIRDPAAAAGPRLLSGEILDKNQCNLLLRDVAMLKGASSSCWRGSTFTRPKFSPRKRNRYQKRFNGNGNDSTLHDCRASDLAGQVTGDL
jgi:hypothetical protein